ncbi:YqaA family protein [Echinimonas agarilytica]|uniref:DedA family protein n=1 Tax=Echinimonas agarilytica TaxID=1215918 RepID=A0AA41W4R9_9GAMM|nr:YqaA family protein [Echinimonas agarilytica]MCM2678840.1 DedA family protein [Echinimonas agarilytica]
MKIFTGMYDWVMEKTKHRLAPVYLAVLSFTESVIFPIPPDVMLAPMALANVKKAWRFALITTVASVIGGAFGYWLGALLFEPVVAPVIESMGYTEKFEHGMAWFKEYGVWIVFVAGFSPIPYKVFTVSAGLLQMAFLPFMIASAIGRGLRFFLVAGLMVWGGKAMEDKLREYVEYLGWLVVVAVVALYFIVKH